MKSFLIFVQDSMLWYIEEIKFEHASLLPSSICCPVEEVNCLPSRESCVTFAHTSQMFAQIILAFQ